MSKVQKFIKIIERSLMNYLHDNQTNLLVALDGDLFVMFVAVTVDNTL
ncbi:hypothetical protein [Aerosakkonema funiforme]